MERDGSGNPVRMIGTHVDVTEKRSAEEQYRRLFDINPLATWIYDFDTLKILAVNQAALETYGYTRDELLQLTIFDVQIADNKELLPKVLWDRDVNDRGHYSHWKHKKKNGEVIIVNVEAITTFYAGRKARLVVITDITGQVKAAEALESAYRRFEYASRATSDAIFDWDITTNHLYWSEGITKLFGYKPADVPIDVWQQYLHPDDKALVLNSLVETLYKTRKRHWRMEFRLRKADGSYGYVTKKGFIIRDAGNNPLRMIGAVQDFTALKLQQLELLESNKRFEYATLAISDIIWDWDIKTNCVLFSDNYEKLTGWPLPDDKCLPFRVGVERLHPEEHSRLAASVKAALADKNTTSWEHEMRHLKSDGSFVSIYNRAHILRSAAGDAVRVIGAIQDMTQRKKLEEELLQQELDKQKLISQATIETQEKERAEIGKELHDNVNQILTTTKLYLEMAGSSPDLRDDMLRRSQANIMQVINEIRQLSHSLMNPSLGDLGLVESLHALAENVGLTGKLVVTIHAAPDVETRVPECLQLAIYRIAQEALNNVIKHANAQEVNIALLEKGKLLELLIQDDGAGFIYDTVKKGAGLKNIENRVYLSNGSLRVWSKPGEGTSLNIQFLL